MIGGVTYTRNENGQHADLILMPVEAFSVEPAVLNPLPPLVQDVEKNNPTKPQSSDLNLPSGSGSQGGGSAFA